MAIGSALSATVCSCYNSENYETLLELIDYSPPWVEAMVSSDTAIPHFGPTMSVDVKEPDDESVNLFDEDLLANADSRLLAFVSRAEKASPSHDDAASHTSPSIQSTHSAQRLVLDQIPRGTSADKLLL